MAIYNITISGIEQMCKPTVKNFRTFKWISLWDVVGNKHFFWSERARAPSASFKHDGTTIIIDFFSSLFLSFFLLSTVITVLP